MRIIVSSDLAILLIIIFYITTPIVFSCLLSEYDRALGTDGHATFSLFSLLPLRVYFFGNPFGDYKTNSETRNGEIEKA